MARVAGDTLRGRRVLVTGGTGFIGQRLLRLLVAAGADVHLLTRRKTLPAPLKSLAIARHRADFEDAASIKRCVADADPEFVLHLARREGSGMSDWATHAALMLGQALRRGAPKLRRLVRAAGPGLRQRDKSVDSRLRAWEIPAVTLEVGLVYGPGQGDMRVVPRLIRVAREGTPLDASWPANPMNFIHVEDAAAAFLQAAIRPGLDGERLVVGGARWLTASEAVMAIRGLLGLPKLDEKPVAKAAGGSLPNVDRGRRLLAWRPKTAFEEGLRALLRIGRQGAHRRMTLEALADVDAGRVLDDKLVRSWAASLGRENR